MGKGSVKHIVSDTNNIDIDVFDFLKKLAHKHYTH